GERLGVADADAGGAGSRVRERVLAAREALTRSVERHEPQFVRLFLTPGQPTLRAVDAEAQAVLAARRHVAGPEAALRPIGKFHGQERVVVDASPWRERGDRPRHSRALQAGDEARHMMHMGADLAEDAGHADAFRIEAPVTPGRLRLFAAHARGAD